MSNVKKTVAEVGVYFQERGCTLLEQEYFDAHRKMRYRCSCGRESSINFNNFRSGKRCGCQRIGLNRLTTEEVKIQVERLGYTFLSEEFENNHHIVKTRCHCGNERVCQLRSLRVGNGCRTCRDHEAALTLSVVREYFQSQGCELLQNEYKNARTKLKYRCSCGRESEIVFDSFRRGNRCRDCGGRKSAKAKISVKTKTKISVNNPKNTDHYEKVRKKSLNNPLPLNNPLTHEQVSDDFRKQGCELLEQYVNSRRSMKYRCICGNVSSISRNNFIAGKRCQECLRKRRSGPSNYQWRIDRADKYLEHRWRQMVYRVLKQIGRKPTASLAVCESLCGYSLDVFKEHIKSQPGYDQFSTWEIDHIFPVWVFTAESGITDLKIINGLDNLRIVPKQANRKKCYKFDPFAFVEWIKAKGVTRC